MRGKDKKICGEIAAESCRQLPCPLAPVTVRTSQSALLIPSPHNNKLYRIKFGYRPTATFYLPVVASPFAVANSRRFPHAAPHHPPISPFWGPYYIPKKVLERWAAFISLYYSTKIIGNMGNELKMCRSNRCCNTTPARRV